MTTANKHECVGLWACSAHPRPYVVKDRHYVGWWVMPPGEGLDRRKRHTLTEAMREARGMVVGNV